MDQPTGYKQPGLGGKKLVAHLLKAVYGLRQSPLAFYDRSGDFFDTIELQAIEADSCLFIGWKDGRHRLLLQYVDDVVAAGEKADVDEMIEKIKGEFVIDDRGDMEEGMLLGMEVKRDRPRRTSRRLYQSRCSRDILERFNMTDVKPARTPMDEHKSLMIDNNLHTESQLRGADQSQYLQAVRVAESMRWRLRDGGSGGTFDSESFHTDRTFLVLFRLLIHRTISNLPWNLSVAI
jgi:hypothetical protein